MKSQMDVNGLIAMDDGGIARMILPCEGCGKEIRGRTHYTDDEVRLCHECFIELSSNERHEAHGNR